MSEPETPAVPPSEPLRPEPPPFKPGKPPQVPLQESKASLRAALDAQIEQELEAAMAGMDAKAMYGEPAAHRPRGPAQRTDGKKKGKVVAIHGDDVFVDVGGRSQGVLSAIQFGGQPPAIGSELDVNIEGYDSANGLLLLSLKGAAVHADWSSVAEGMIVEGRVTGTNKGGLEIDINGIRGFMPVSQIDLYRVEDLNPYVNQRLRCLVTDVNPAERNLVVSARALLEKEREEAREKLWKELAEGQVRTGIVRSIKDFGAFLDLGGVDGLLHVSEMSWSRVDNAANLVQPGQSMKVVILKIDHERRKVSLGLKQLLPSPWDSIGEKYWANQLVTGKVTRLMDFGAFVELEPGIEGLIHVSELAPQRVWRVSDIVQPNQMVEVRVLKIEKDQKRISLSLKAAAPEPQQTAAVEEDEPEKPVKPLPQRKTPLRGGIGE
jgi:small subunit ribosomal protein S1